jgi:integrase
MATIKFLLQSDKNPASIYVRLVAGRKCDVKVKTNFIINPSDWSLAKQRPKSLKNESFKNLDVELQNLKTHILESYNKSSGIVDLNWLKNVINPKIENEIPVDIVSYIDVYMESRKNELPDAKVRLLKVLQQKLKVFQGNTNLLIENIGSDFKSKFQSFCIEKNYAINSISTYFTYVKMICNHAKKRGLKTSLQLEEVVLAKVKTPSIYLNFEELESIEKTDFSELVRVGKQVFQIEELRDARDWLVISCYCGQRFSDFIRFSKEMIRDQNGVKLIEFQQQKTKKWIALPLHKKIIEILDKRGGDFPAWIEQSTYNLLVKTVGEAAEINEVVSLGLLVKKRKKQETLPKFKFISSHIGRRSFATNFYGKIPTPLLMAATGHGSESTFLIYIGKSSADQAMELSKWF